jgi:hypothetical protein
MQSNPHRFNQYRRQNNPTGGVINTTVSEIMRYVIDCYLVMINDKPIFSKSKFKETTTYKFEDYLSDRFVDDYLRMNRKEYFAQTQLSQIIFTKQSSERYEDCNTQIQQPDLIDVYITGLNLHEELCSNPQPYLAIECKRIYKSVSVDEYIDDIRKFTEREYYLARLPFEAQMAFIESHKYAHNITVENINQKLQIHRSIKTTQSLKPIQFHEKFDASYSSKHKRNFGAMDIFSIFHLLFDYSQIVVH